MNLDKKAIIVLFAEGRTAPVSTFCTSAEGAVGKHLPLAEAKTLYMQADRIYVRDQETGLLRSPDGHMVKSVRPSDKKDSSIIIIIDESIQRQLGPVRPRAVDFSRCEFVYF